jgi:hypothetical protein
MKNNYVQDDLSFSSMKPQHVVWMFFPHSGIPFLNVICPHWYTASQRNETSGRVPLMKHVFFSTIHVLIAYWYFIGILSLSLSLCVCVCVRACVLLLSLSLGTCLLCNTMYLSFITLQVLRETRIVL